MSISNLPNLLFEDYYLLVCNKPAGISTEIQKHDYPSLEQQCLNYLQSKYPDRKHYYLRPVHRLDRPASGVVIFAKTPAALKHVNEQIEKRQIDKVYQAYVEGDIEVESGTLRHWIMKDALAKKSIVVNPQTKNSKEAILHYATLNKVENFTALRIQLETGRYHQVRCQLAAIGHPIINDLLYGAKKIYEENMIRLHATEYNFLHPKTNQLLKISAPLPEDFFITQN